MYTHLMSGSKMENILLDVFLAVAVSTVAFFEKGGNITLFLGPISIW